MIFDVDSTLSGLEGIDWLADLRGRDAGRRIANLTAHAMSGTRQLEDVYGARLGEVRPSAAEIAELAEAYRVAVAPGAALAIKALRAAGVRVVLVTSGIEQAVIPLAGDVGVAPEDIYAIRLRFDEAGSYAGFDDDSPLVRAAGKRMLVSKLDLPCPVLAVGDGATDAELRGEVDEFWAFTGFVRRDVVVRRADRTVASFGELRRLVLGE